MVGYGASRLTHPTDSAAQAMSFERGSNRSDGILPEIVEYEDHPWFIGVQFHPELKSRPFEPHPLFASFIEAAVERNRLV